MRLWSSKSLPARSPRRHVGRRARARLRSLAARRRRSDRVRLGLPVNSTITTPWIPAYGRLPKSPGQRQGSGRGIGGRLAAAHQIRRGGLLHPGHGRGRSNLARYDGVRYGRRAQGVKDLDELYTRSRTEGFGEEVQRRILLGAFVLSAGYYDAYYRKAAQVRRLIRKDYDEALARCDAR